MIFCPRVRLVLNMISNSGRTDELLTNEMIFVTPTRITLNQHVEQYHLRSNLISFCGILRVGK